jgi:hypothetical protein
VSKPTKTKKRPFGHRASATPRDTALPPPRGLLLGQAPGAKAAFFYRETVEETGQKKYKLAKDGIKKITLRVRFEKT